MKQFYTLIFAFSITVCSAQSETSKQLDPWPYSMPIFGKKATERGYKIQLPYGLNVNYVYNRMDLEITEFAMGIGDDLNSPLNQLIQEYVTLENLNFTNTIARTNGINVRADVWLFPFLNVYGLYSNSQGSTEVSLQPQWYTEDGDLALSLPTISSKVDFSANTLGIGTTVVGKIYKDYFFSVDGNVTWSRSELLNDAAVLSVVSARIGERLNFKNGTKLALYIGGMYRGFIDSQGNIGAVVISEALPEIGSNVFAAVDSKIAANNEEISGLDPNNPIDAAQIAVLEKKNEVLSEVNTAFEGLVSSSVNYKIKKDIINHWSIQFGFNYEIDPKLTLRGEFGKGTGNDFVLLGVQYRFGI